MREMERRGSLRPAPTTSLAGCFRRVKLGSACSLHPIAASSTLPAERSRPPRRFPIGPEEGDGLVVNGLSVGVPLIIGQGASNATLDMNGQQVTLESLLVNSSSATFNFATPGVDLLTVSSLTINNPVAISFGTNPTTPGSYELIADTYDTFTMAQLRADFTLPTVPGMPYELTAVPGVGIYLSLYPVPEPGTLALLGRWISERVGLCLAA